MKIFVLILTLIGCYGLAYAQSKKDSVGLYYQFKNRAEIAIIDSQYSEALALYNEAFSFKKPNARELYNAFVAAYITRNDSYADEYFDEMVRHGLKKDIFEQSKYFGASIANDSLYKYISIDYNTLRNNALKSKMSILAEKMNKILNEDQEVRKTSFSAIHNVDSFNRSSLKSFIVRYGFPGFERVGFFDNMVGNHARNPSTFWFVMWHARYEYVPLDQVAYQAVIDGDFPPDDYALLMDTKDPDNRIYYEILPRQIMDKKVKLLTPLNEQEIDNKRATIFLDNLQNYKKKLYFMEEGDHRFQFLPVMGQSMNFAQ